MTLWHRLRSRLRATLHRSHLESEIDAELHFHIQSFADDLVRSGVPREEALRRARIPFVSLELTKEECRDARGITLVETLLQDLRYAARMLRKSPGFALVSVLALTFGIAFSSFIFSIFYNGVLNPFPYRDPHRLTVISVLETTSSPTRAPNLSQ